MLFVQAFNPELRKPKLVQFKNWIMVEEFYKCSFGEYVEMAVVKVNKVSQNIIDWTEVLILTIRGILVRKHKPRQITYILMQLWNLR